MADIRSRGNQVLFVGGTPLYLKSLLRGVYQGPPADWQFRTQIDEELKTLPVAALHQRLEIIDPLLAAKLHPNDKRRIIRGLEVFRLTGQRLSHLQTQFDESQAANQPKVFVLSWPREALHQRINDRVEQMFAAGLVEEVRGLLAKHGSLSRTARQAVGYSEVMELLEEEASGSGGSEGDPGIVGESLRGIPRSASTAPLRLAACMEQVKIRTRQFARRQETWFRSLSECRLVAMEDGETSVRVAERIIQLAIE